MSVFKEAKLKFGDAKAGRLFLCGSPRASKVLSSPRPALVVAFPSDPRGAGQAACCWHELQRREAALLARCSSRTTEHLRERGSCDLSLRGDCLDVVRQSKSVCGELSGREDAAAPCGSPGPLLSTHHLVQLNLDTAAERELVGGERTWSSRPGEEEASSSAGAVRSESQRRRNSDSGTTYCTSPSQQFQGIRLNGATRAGGSDRF
ncbi:hypothetical protein MPTK1_2g13075 [Marchantia polymorpha subsp. ruderalis]